MAAPEIDPLDLCAVPDPAAGRRMSPTIVSQYIRLEQCRRYLRLALHHRAAGPRFLYEYDVAPQEILPLLTKSGAEFEAAVEQAAADVFAVRNLARERAAAGRDEDVDELLSAVRELPAGQTMMLFQPRLRVTVDGWDITGDADIVRCERDGGGALKILVVDMKSTRTAKVEHRLQVAFYRQMLARILADASVPCEEIEIGILYRGEDASAVAGDPEAMARIPVEREAAERLFATPAAQLELTPDPDAYSDAVRDLVTGPDSVARQVCATPFAAVPWHLTYKCDGCLYNEFCLKWAAEHDDLSLLPHLTEQDKTALLQNGIATTTELAHLKRPTHDSVTGKPDLLHLVAENGKEALVGRVARAWPVGPRLDELVHRARRYRRQAGDAIEMLRYIPSKGYGSLPYSAAEQNPNLVRVFIDAQHDYLNDRVYLIGSLITGNVGGEPDPARRRSIVHITDGPPDAEAEGTLLAAWVAETIRAIAEVAAPDERGEAKAPIHLIFYDSFEQRLLLQALGRHAQQILGAAPLYDFITQLAAFDSPVATFLDREIRELKNYPMVCQSLQAVAAIVRPGGVHFDWNQPAPYRAIFRERLFDSQGRWGAPREDGREPPWYTRRARFASQIPLEYAYQAWGALEPPPATGADPYAGYRRATVDLLVGFQGRRLEALEHISKDFPGNRDTTKSVFAIPDLAHFTGKARGLAEALQEFVTIERHVELAAWKGARLAEPERRVLAGDTLLARCLASDQFPGVMETYAENRHRAELHEEQRQAYFAAHPEAKQARLSAEEKALSAPIPIAEPFRLRLDTTGTGIDLDDALALSTLKAGDRVVLAPRWTQDERLPVEERVNLTPTPKQLLYRMRLSLEEIEVDRNAEGRAKAAWLHVRPTLPMSSNDPPGFLFGSHDEELIDGERYSVDSDPNDIYGLWGAKVVKGLNEGGRNTFFARVSGGGALVNWPEAAREGQARFMAGLRAMHGAGAAPELESSKVAFIGDHGEAPLLLVQGPPGTGKSFTTAFAILARMQGAMAAQMPFHVVAGAKTHAATNVLLEHLLGAQRDLARWREAHPTIFATHFDARLLDVPVFRLQPRGDVPDSATAIRAGDRKEKGQDRALDVVTARPYAIVASTPGGIYRAAQEQTGGLFAQQNIELLVLDEASQLSLPESIMAALPLRMDGQIIVVGDHRQMAPIVKHDWANETRRTFQDYAVYRSLFDTVRALDPVMIQFTESFRLHRDMAEFLRQSVYAHDHLAYYSRRHGALQCGDAGDPFVVAALDPLHPLVVIVHDEAASQLRNDFERRLTAPLLAALYQAGYRVEDGFGLVVPHRAQRANLQDALRGALPGAEDPDAVAAAVDTVERFQGGERDAIIVSATESDPAYLVAAGGFLYDPRRLTVAISRAKDKMILVASRSVFALFSPDEEIFANAQIWKDLLYRACTVPLWNGEIGEHRVEVWGNRPLIGVLDNLSADARMPPRGTMHLATPPRTYSEEMKFLASSE
jgi:hypothetical protein